MTTVPALTWVYTDQRGSLSPLGPHGICWQCQEENIETGKPKPSQTGVVDDVEDGDLEPGEGGPRQDLSCPRVVQEVLESFHTRPVPSFRLDGSASQVLRSWTLTLAHVSSTSG